MGILTSLLDALFLAFFVIHIPTTLLVDAQSVLPADWFPLWAREMLQWHIKTNGDHLVATNPVWFKSLICCELTFQLPFFFIATYAFITKANWIRIPCIIYGSHVATTVVPILGDFLFGPEAGPNKYVLASINAPFLVIPLLLVIRMAMVEQPWGSVGAGKRRGGKSKAQ
ncbi:hypothetical protein HYH03_017234 [Edaphochlamys debaryana]|uniref:EXPERA domain-containing protein n=1 Tax=Edaphochlamys debaryana TaxID=47281 RepID=A0A836BQS8_9CHLO|nr:hypothetical protein HYH03_017234 [Edaphochlamys debaryana]|eukprot:KAG2483913.1 hypothetical protein HYH03_017234 [Edaphochlamys debaryana]